MFLPTGQRFVLPITSKFASEAFISNADVDWGSEALLFKLLKNEGVFLDVGANIGYYSLYMLPKVNGVYSFEPDPRTLKILEQNVQFIQGVNIVPVAIGKMKGKINFTLEDDGEVSHINLEKNNLSEKNIQVDVTTIDEFVQDNELRVEAIKIDIEGFDIDAIAGSIATLLSQRPIVLTEAAPVKELFDITGKVNYRVLSFLRDIKTRQKHFDEIWLGTSSNFTTKMLFLIPEERADSILELVRSDEK
jgi:FkbM family methyltransferase